MKKSIWIPLLVVGALLVIGTSQYPKLSIATGYGAKCMASGVFVASRAPENVKENDLNYSLVKYTTSSINYIDKSVTTSIFGMAKQKAVYREGFGCCLVGEPTPSELFSGSSPIKITTESSWKKPWPEGDAKSDTLFPEIDSASLQHSIDAAFDNPETCAKRTAAVIVVYKGKLIAEKYWKEHSITADTKLWGWSMCKSITNAMVGVLVKQGKLSVNAIAPIEEWMNDKRREITINDLLHMCSGLKWNEDYGDVSDVTTLLYKERNSYQYAISFPYEKQPDTEWKYSSATTNILTGIIRKTINDDKQYFEFPYNEIFRKIGMNSMVLETDASGNFVGSSYCYGTARDWAKFGLLYMNDGVWKGDSILPKGWVQYSTTSSKPANGRYGAQFWLNRSRELPDAPEDLYTCKGHRGQRIFIIPSKHLIVVRLGFAENKFDHNSFLKGIMDSFGAPKY
jgi:CubicO group peptidase (beta-lactamase class C family)